MGSAQKIKGASGYMCELSVLKHVSWLQVIYGDTDSIMVNTRCTDVAKSREIASQIIRKVNAPYSKLELALDGMYKVILLLKKKKYAAIKLETDQNGTPFSREVCHVPDALQCCHPPRFGGIGQQPYTRLSVRCST